jgi:hypothetical protein
MRPAKWIEAFGIAVLLATAAHAQAPAQAGEVHVMVIASETQKPMAGVEVALSPVYCEDCPDNELDFLSYLQGLAAANGVAGLKAPNGLAVSPAMTTSRTAVSDEAGLAVFRDLKFTKYQVAPKRAGYVAGNSPVVKVDRDQPAPDVLVALYPAVTISGHVRDAQGKPVADAAVLATRVRSETGTRVFVRRRTAVGSDGRYTLTVEAPGEYLLNAQTISQGVVTTALEKEKAITVEAGKDPNDIDFEFPPKAR